MEIVGQNIQFGENVWIRSYTAEGMQPVEQAQHGIMGTISPIAHASVISSLPHMRSVIFLNFAWCVLEAFQPSSCKLCKYQCELWFFLCHCQMFRTIIVLTKKKTTTTKEPQRHGNETSFLCYIFQFFGDKFCTATCKSLI